ncbi:recombination protein NinG [Paraburkholderia tropica]|uniref:recombination protein NinG n=1 Tax=Paraburkholderia tropica TaxID=92647 RepID=UPI003D2DB0EA
MRRFLVGVRSFGSMEGGLIRTSLPIKKALKPKRCRHCGNSYTPISSMSKACSTPCAIALMEKQRAQKLARAQRDERKSIRQALEKAKTRGQHLKEAQAAFNAYVRERDFGLPCISCGLPPKQVFGGAVDCGHYRSTGSAAHQRFNLKNCAAQCVKCNRYLGSNTVEMRKGMIARFGIKAIEALEQDQTPRKFDIEYLTRIKRIFRKKTRRAKATRESMREAA